MEFYRQKVATHSTQPSDVVALNPGQQKKKQTTPTKTCMYEVKKVFVNILNNIQLNNLCHFKTFKAKYDCAWLPTTILCE